MPYYPMTMMANPYYYCCPQIPGLQGCVDSNSCKLKVEGKGSVMAQPDMAEVVLGVSTEDKQLKAAQEENAKIAAQILNTLRTLGVDPEDIQTQSYTIEPQYDYVEGKQVFRSYRVLYQFKVTIRNIDGVGEIIDAAVESGANIVNSISFTISDPSMYYQQALNSAIDDALSKAGTIGSKLGVKIFPTPVSIFEEGYQYGSPVSIAFQQVAVAATPIQTGQIEVTARIEAVFAYTPF